MSETSLGYREPFMAIVPDKRAGGYFDKTHAVYIVNPLAVSIENVRVETGGFFSTDEWVLQAAPVQRKPIDLRPRSASITEYTSQDELDEVMCWWTVVYTIEGQDRKVSFSAGKGCRDAPWHDCVAILNRGAHVMLPKPET